MIVWAGQPRCGLTEFQGRLCGPGSHVGTARKPGARSAIRKLNSEPTPGSFGVVLLNPGNPVCLPLWSALSLRSLLGPGEGLQGQRGRTRERERENHSGHTPVSAPPSIPIGSASCLNQTQVSMVMLSKHAETAGRES